MIITKTPLRISLVGGSTDLPAFYNKARGGVVSFAIDKFMYVSVHPSFDGNYIVNYTGQEKAGSPSNLGHEIAKNALLYYETPGVELSSISDVPGRGTGLGSSSAYAVGLSLALSKLSKRKTNRHPCHFAEDAFHIECNMAGKPVGKQDHYASAYGDLHYFSFYKDEPVLCEIIADTKKILYGMYQRLMLFYTGTTRNADVLLSGSQRSYLEDKNVFKTGEKMAELALQLRNDLKRGVYDHVGQYLHENWMLKQNLAEGINTAWIDTIYLKAIQAGAEGGKICGAGGGGFLLLWAQPENHSAIEEAIGLRRIPFNMCKEGARVVYQD